MECGANWSELQETVVARAEAVLGEIIVAYDVVL